MVNIWPESVEIWLLAVVTNVHHMCSALRRSATPRYFHPGHDDRVARVALHTDLRKARVEYWCDQNPKFVEN